MFILCSHIYFLNSTSRAVTGHPWRCFSTLWTNTGWGRGRCIITTTSCVSLYSAISDDRSLRWFTYSISSFILWALAQAVHILSMMEKDISSREAEVRSLKQEVGALNFQAAAQKEEHKTEISTLSAQLEEARSAAVSGLFTWKQV